VGPSYYRKVMLLMAHLAKVDLRAGSAYPPHQAAQGLAGIRVPCLQSSVVDAVLFGQRGHLIESFAALGITPTFILKKVAELDTTMRTHHTIGKCFFPQQFH
jgi:hypothetical protein